VRLATAIQQARNEGMPVGLLSGVRQPSDHPSPYDLKGDSSHEYGVAGDVSGIGPAGSATSARWRQIAEANGLNSPYDPNGGEWNHWQIGPRLETAPTLLNNLKMAKATGNPQDMWNAFDAGGGAGGGVGGSTVAQGPNFYDVVEQHESGGKNIQNSAGADAWGYYQFTTPTWQGVKSAHPELKLPEGSILSANHDQQLAAYKALVSGNVAKLQAAGIPINDKNVFMASFLGAGGATKFLQALKNNPNDVAAPAFSKEAAANPTVFMDGQHARTYADIYALMTSKFGGGNTTGFGPGAVAGGSSTAPVASPQTPAQVSPWATLGSSLGEALGQMSNTQSASSQVIDPPDAPPIRTPAMEADFTPPASSPVPQTLAGGIAPMLASLALQPQPLPTTVEDPGSITAGAPSMTAMLGGVGTSTDPTLIDPRRTNSINPYTRPLMRLG
jgi:hypothetical protein